VTGTTGFQWDYQSLIAQTSLHH